MEETVYTIGELAEAIGVTPRTIRYYTGEGLLPPPDTRGRYALYGEEHALRLQLISRLKDAYLPLTEIKARLEQLTIEQVRELLAEYGQPPATLAQSSAADYVAQVLSTQVAPQAPRKLAESAAEYQSAPPGPIGFRPQASAERGGAAPTLPQPNESPAPLQPGVSLPLAPPSGGQAIPPPDAPPVPAASPPGLLRRLIPQRREREGAPPTASAQPGSGETWQRVILAPGIELHLREPLAPKLRERAERLIDQARELFKGTE